ncbi:MAG: hypothetical protein ACRDN0_08075, partial [Trebonia sp.]
MKSSMRAAVAVGIGYMLGRRRKFRTAAIVAAGMAVGGTPIGSLALGRATKMLGSADVLGKVSPQLGDLVDTVRGDLITAGKAAATAAVTNRVDALTDSIHERAERVRDLGGVAAEGAEQVSDTARETTGRAGSGAKRAASRARRAADPGTSADSEPD